MSRYLLLFVMEEVTMTSPLIDEEEKVVDECQIQTKLIVI